VIVNDVIILGGHSFDERRPKLLGDCGGLALVELEHRLDDGDFGGRRVLKRKDDQGLLNKEYVICYLLVRPQYYLTQSKDSK